jgi:hypothetical protein
LVAGALVWYLTSLKGNVKNSTAQELLTVEPSGPRLLLPDIVVAAPKELYISGVGENRKMRFSTTFMNQGEGPLELIRHLTPDQKANFASQFVRQVDGKGVYRDVGTFIYHPGHNHWHIENYVQYQLWSINTAGGREEMLLKTEKMSFCVWDENAFDLKLPSASQKAIYSRNCGREVQGMSVGWSDTYLAKVEGQEISIGSLPDGTYLFVSIVNPDKKILESNYDNNSNPVLLELKGNRLIRRE